MNSFKFVCNWQAGRNDAPEYEHTMADLSLHVGDVNLMLNEDIWSRSIRESALLSAYPLAMWLASSWWRLNWEPLPLYEACPFIDWRMAHELGAANQGYVWPQIVFASDGAVMQVWAEVMKHNDNQSVRYLNSLEEPAFVGLTDFQRSVADFIKTVLCRLEANGCFDTDLAKLWNLIETDSADTRLFKLRRIEARMGYEPEECPKNLITQALNLENKMGEEALFELIPIYGKKQKLSDINHFVNSKGVIGKPQLKIDDSSNLQSPPWQRAVYSAGALRKSLDNTRNKVSNQTLCDLLGIKLSDVDNFVCGQRSFIALAVPKSDKQYKYIPRKKHPLAKRFELARFIGDLIWVGTETGQWLTSTDLSTSRQKYQRAFAAEFLCPVKALQEFLCDDCSESAIEDATEHFGVSETTIKTVLVNNHIIPFSSVSDYNGNRLPYLLPA